MPGRVLFPLKHDGREDPDLGAPGEGRHGRDRGPLQARRPLREGKRHPQRNLLLQEHHQKKPEESGSRITEDRLGQDHGPQGR